MKKNWKGKRFDFSIFSNESISLSGNLAHLTCLKVHYCEEVGTGQTISLLFDILSSFQVLEELSFGYLFRTERYILNLATFDAINGSRVKKLCIKMFVYRTDRIYVQLINQSLLYALRLSPQLRHLELSGYSGVSRYNDLTIELTAHNQLKSLSIIPNDINRII
jgi:hypothetical protein